jgi:hypothetical protein
LSQIVITYHHTRIHMPVSAGKVPGFHMRVAGAGTAALHKLEIGLPGEPAKVCHMQAPVRTVVAVVHMLAVVVHTAAVVVARIAIAAAAHMVVAGAGHTAAAVVDCIAFAVVDHKDFVDKEIVM